MKLKQITQLIEKAYTKNIEKKGIEYIQPLLVKCLDAYRNIEEDGGLEDTWLTKQGFAIHNLNTAINHLLKIKKICTQK